MVQRYKCPGCGERVHAQIPEAYRGDFGPRLKALVAELRVLGMPFEKIAELLRMNYDLEVSVASLLAMEEGGGGVVGRDLSGSSPRRCGTPSGRPTPRGTRRGCR